MTDSNDSPVMKRRKRIITAWRALAPAVTLNGMTLEQFEEVTKPSEEVRERIDAMNVSLDGLRQERFQADDRLRDEIAGLVDSLKGNPEYGANRPLYSAFGYVPRDARKSGLTRKDSTTTTTEGTDAA